MMAVGGGSTVGPRHSWDGVIVILAEFQVGQVLWSIFWQRYQNAVAGSCSFDASSHWERKLSSVQRRYLRAIETLARVRKLMGIPMVQINIATEGGKQVVSNA